MLRVTVDLVPYGIEEQKRTLEIVEIINVYTTINDVGHYEVHLTNDDEAVHGEVSHVRGFGHRPLVLDALMEVYDKSKTS